MPFVRENQFYAPGRKFQADRASHTKNLRALETYFTTGQDLVALLDKVTLPGVDEVSVGTIVRIGDTLRFLTSTGWKTITLT